MGIEVERIGTLHALHQVPVLRTREGRARVSGVDVQPHVLFVADLADFLQVVESARARGSQGADHETRVQSVLFIFGYRLPEGLCVQGAVLVAG